MHPNPIMMALANILHQLLKDIWIPLKILVRNDNHLSNVAAPFLSTVTSVSSSQNLLSFLHCVWHSRFCETPISSLVWQPAVLGTGDRMVSDIDTLAS